MHNSTIVARFIPAVIWVAMVVPALASPTEEELDSRVREFFLPAKQDTTPAEIRRIDAAIGGKKPEVAVKLATAVIKRAEPSIARQREQYIKSLALLRRAQARRLLSQKDEKVNQDLLQAAQLGNLEAINILVQTYVNTSKGGGPATALALPGVDIDEVIEIGLYLADAHCIQAALDGYYKKGLSPSRRAFYELLLAYMTKNTSLLNRLSLLGQKLDIGAVLRDHAIVGGVLGETKNRQFDRDTLATIAAESNLRNTLARGLGFAQPAVRPEKELSLREIIEVNAWVGEMSGMTTLYHLIAQPASLAHSFYVPRPELGREIGVGDTIHVRCGGMAHTAVVFGVDAARDQLLLADPLLQFWQPTHNTCISSFDEVHLRYGYYLARLKLSEVGEILDAVQKMGSFSPPGFTRDRNVFGSNPPDLDAISSDCTTTSDGERGFLGMPFDRIVRQDFFTFFNFQEWKREGGGSGTAILFLPAVPEFRGDVMVATWIDSRSCVRTFSTFLRRTFVEGNQSPFAMDIIRNFFSQAVSEKQRAALINAKAPLIGPKGEAIQGGISEVLSEVAEAVVVQVPGAILHVRNVESDTGAKWIRMDLR